ncbi:mutatorlike transposase [Plasmopara halstedii]|uniref:Mutatorlike transposase n=1 Tax=Plasmopara halstedii TaxID=4781 RepID=A0A0P1AVR7_PLAHL|nr:mutatorlike transposase [Plasmopara halstedii]CEG46503.1 mutatorlike transposase [Plasmopara halstedii]|eukprot:XP_024582872.1 mutatorlike transposase [Plasmopara halstedii]
MFKRAFLAHPFVALYQHSNGLQPVFGLDTAPLVSVNYRGQMFVLLGKDGNNEVIPLCVAVAPQSDAANWRWFLMNCQQAQVDFSRSVFLADRTRCLLAAIEGLGLLVRQCTQHLITNLKDMVKSLPTEQVEDLVRRAQAADSEAEFSSCLSMIGLTCPTAENYLRSMDPCTWTLFCISQQIKLYGWNSTQFSAEDHKSLLSLAPYDLMQHYMEKFMTLSYKQSVLAKTWAKDGKLFTEYAEKLLAEQQEGAKFQVVQPSDDSVMFVTESRSFPPRRYRVDLNQRVCSCTYLFQMGVPCRHFLAGLNFCKRSKDVAEYVDICYKSSTFVKQYDSQRTGSIELLLDSELEENRAVKAPIMARKRGRPKKKPLASSGETIMTPAVANALLKGENKLLQLG